MSEILKLRTRAEIDDVVAFMQTLSDGYLKDNPYRAERQQQIGGKHPVTAR